MIPNHIDNEQHMEFVLNPVLSLSSSLMKLDMRIASHDNIGLPFHRPFDIPFRLKLCTYGGIRAPDFNILSHCQN